MKTFDVVIKKPVIIIDPLYDTLDPGQKKIILHSISNWIGSQKAALSSMDKVEVAAIKTRDTAFDYEVGPAIDLMQECVVCKELKPLSSFNKNRLMKNGHDPRCKSCRHTEYKARTQRKKKQNSQNDGD